MARHDQLVEPVPLSDRTSGLIWLKYIEYTFKGGIMALAHGGAGYRTNLVTPLRFSRRSVT